MVRTFVVYLADTLPETCLEAADAESALYAAIAQAFDAGLTPGDLALINRDETWVYEILDIDRIFKDAIDGLAA